MRFMCTPACWGNGFAQGGAQCFSRPTWLCPRPEITFAGVVTSNRRRYDEIKPNPDSGPHPPNCKPGQSLHSITPVVIDNFHQNTFNNDSKITQEIMQRKANSLLSKLIHLRRRDPCIYKRHPITEQAPHSQAWGHFRWVTIIMPSSPAEEGWIPTGEADERSHHQRACHLNPSWRHQHRAGKRKTGLSAVKHNSPPLS